MIQIFKGKDPRYQIQYDDFKNLLEQEYALSLQQPTDSNIYIYWCCADLQARGGVEFALCSKQQQYMLKNIVFSYPEQACDNAYELRGVEFYRTIYHLLYNSIHAQALQLGEYAQSCDSLELECTSRNQELIAFPTLSSTQLCMKLYGEALSDCTIYGCWPYFNEKEITENCFTAVLSLSPQDHDTCLTALKKFDPKPELKVNKTIHQQERSFKLQRAINIDWSFQLRSAS